MSQDEMTGRILIVDDTLKNIQVLGTILRKEEYQINVAQNGLQAIKMAETVIPDLILLDVMMPELDGFETCKRLKTASDTKDIPVIFLTAKTETEDIVKGFELGAVDYVTKPFNATELLVRVRTHLTLRNLQKDLEQRVKDRTAELADANESLNQTNTAYSRFVPMEFLQLLHQKSILNIQLGDQVQMDMNVLFSDIVSFTSLSEQMNPQENFNFINAFLKRVSPTIRKHNGFIDKFVGDAIMALFPDKADDAVRAAISMQKEVSTYNEHRVEDGYQPIGIGVGLHTGNLMLGVIGEEERMDSSVISDAVNVASRMEGLTRRYRAAVVVSEDTYNKIEQPDDYNLRRLEKVQVMGKHDPVMVFEAFDGDPAELLALKQKTRSDFEHAISLYYEKKFAEANLCIAKVLSENPSDRAAQLYQGRIAQLMANGVPPDWTGVEVLTAK